MSEGMAPIGRVAGVGAAAAVKDAAPAHPPPPARATAGMNDPERSRSASEISPAAAPPDRRPDTVPPNPSMVAQHVRHSDAAENGRSTSSSRAGMPARLSTSNEGSAVGETTSASIGSGDPSSTCVTIGAHPLSSRFSLIRNDKWRSRFEELQRFKAARGHCRATVKRDGQLGHWVKKQRDCHKQWTQSGRPAGVVADRMEALRGLGFEFSFNTSLEENWRARLEAIKAFKLKHGHCTVPRQGDYAPLSNWLSMQRRYYKARFYKGKNSPMTDERVEALEALGFEWDAFHERLMDKSKWHKRLQQLKEFKQRHGHCCVRKHHDNSLCYWIDEQRKNYRCRVEGKLSPMTDERVEALEGIGFLWDAKRETELAQREGTLKCASRAPRSRAPATPNAAMTASELKAKQLRLEHLREKRKKENDERKKEHEQAQQSLLEEQERLFREAAARVRSKQQGSASIPVTAPKFFSHPVVDLNDLDDGHWKWSDPHARLGLPQSSSLVDIKKQYRKLSLLYHPDKSSREDALERFHAVKDAYECLCRESE